MLSLLTQLRLLKERSKTKKEFPQINKDLSSLESNSKTADLFLTTISKKSQLFIWSSDLEVECKSSSRPSLEKPSLSMLSHLTPLKPSRERSKTRKVSPQINKDSSLLESNSRTEDHFLTTTSKKNQPSTWCSDSEVECKSLSKL